MYWYRITQLLQKSLNIRKVKYLKSTEFPRDSGISTVLLLVQLAESPFQVAVERLLFVVIAAEVGYDLVEFPRLYIAGYRLDELEIFINEDRCREAWLVVAQRHSPRVDTPFPLGHEMVAPVSQLNALALFGVEFDGVVIFVDIVCDLSFGIGFPVHYLAPTAPVGVEVDQYLPGFFLVEGVGFLRCDPVYVSLFVGRSR